MRRRVNLINLGLTHFKDCLEVQKQLVHAKLHSTPEPSDTIFVTQHYPVFTGGRRIKEPLHFNGFDFIDRGGQVTFHNPGQLVVYPVLNLRTFGLGVRDYVTQLQDVIADSLRQLGLRDLCLDSGVGIWTRDGAKIASIGVQIRSWITMHGFAINVTNSLGPFSLAEICGEKDARMARLCDYLPEVTSTEMIIQPLVRSFERLMDMEIETDS